MTSREEILSVFDGQTCTWENLVRTAVGVSWEDWETGSGAFAKIEKFPKLLADEIATYSKNYDVDINRALRNAVALAPKEQLPLARLVVLRLHRSGFLSDSEDEWLEAFPCPAPFEEFISERLSGRFTPKAEAFSFLVCAINHEKSQFTALNNLLACLAPISGSSRRLFERLIQSGLPEQVPPKILFQSVALRAQSEPLEPDMESGDLAALPQVWRRTILGDRNISRLVLMPATIAWINSAPLEFSDTPESVQSRALLDSLSKELAAGRLSGSCLASLLQEKVICEEIERRIDWSVLCELSKPIKLDFTGRAMPSANELRFRTQSGKLFSNLTLVALSGQPEIFLPRREADIDVIRQLVVNADRNVLRFAVSKSTGNSQFFIMQCALSNEADADFQQLAVDTFFAQINPKKALPRTLNLALRRAPRDQQVLGFHAAFGHAEHSSSLLSWNAMYADWFIERLSRGDVPGFAVSPEFFHTYNAMGESGGLIVEALLRHCAGGKISQRSILVNVLQHAPSLTRYIFRERRVRLKDFISLIVSSSFRGFQEDDQIAALALRAHRGKSALQLAFESGELTVDFLEWLRQQEALKNIVARSAPELLPLQVLPLSEVLVGVTSRPSIAPKVLANIERSRLVEALPLALAALKDRPRIAAALELAVRSDISALSEFMRLASRLAPPYEAKDFGRRFDDLYSVYEIPKRSGGMRSIAAPAPHLKAAQRALLKLLYDEGVSEHAMGFVPGRGTRDNAMRHIGQDFVVNADVRAFFPSTSYRRVYSLAYRLCDGQLSQLSARLFAEICCHAGNLATGAPTSPALSNLILRDLDARLHKIADRLGVRYSRYADDLTFSGEVPAVWMLKPAKTLLAGLGYELDPKKTNIFRKGRRQIVTGAVVNEKVNLARTLRKALRAAVDHRVQGKRPFLQGRPLTDAMLHGHLSYFKMLSPESAMPLLQKIKGATGWPY